MLPCVLSIIAALVVPFTTATVVKRSNGCNNNACLKAVVGKQAKPCKVECSSFLQITVTPCASTVFTTVTKTTTNIANVPATATSTTLVTVTQTESVVETDYVSVTATTTNFETATATEDVIVTVTTGVVGGPPFKRDINTEDNPFWALTTKNKRAVVQANAVTHRPTSIPASARACANSAAYSSACSCIGVTAHTITAHRPTVTKTVTKTYSKTNFVTTTVRTAVVTSTAQTNTITTTYSTEFITTTVATEEVDTTIATQTVIETATVDVPPNPTQTVQLLAIGSQDPRLSVTNGIGFTELESFRGSTYVFYFDFTANAATTQLWGVNAETGELTAIGGPGTSDGEAMYYSTFGGLVPVSYVNISTKDFADSQGGQAAVCKIAEGSGYEYLQCKWGDNQIAEFWTCAGRLNLAQPGYDFTSSCRDASTSYKIPLIRVQRV